MAPSSPTPVAELFSAAMATVSADLNWMAGGAMKDFCQRVLRPQAFECALDASGRMLTLVLGAWIMLISLWLTQANRASLFLKTAFQRCGV